MKLYPRSMIVAQPGNCLVSCDLSQAESWIVAYCAREKSMQWSLNNSDIHTDTASALFFPENFCTHSWLKGAEEIRTCTNCNIIIVKTARYIGKRYNHASAYRMKPPRAAQVINKDSDKPPYVTVTLSESKTYSERWHKKYNLKLWWTEIEQDLSNTRTTITPYGRRRTYFAQWGEELFKEATANIPQSTVADHFNGMVHPELQIPGGLRTIYRTLVKPYSDRRIVNQSHDSFIAELPKQDGLEFALASKQLLLRPLVIHGEQFTIPVDAEWGERWGELEKAA